MRTRSPGTVAARGQYVYDGTVACRYPGNGGRLPFLERQLLLKKRFPTQLG